MNKPKLNTAKYVHVNATNSIGVIIDKGIDSSGPWYRTDCDGIREPIELLFLRNKTQVLKCAKQLNAHIADSTKKLIGLP